MSTTVDGIEEEADFDEIVEEDIDPVVARTAILSFKWGNRMLYYIFSSVPDPWHFGVDPDLRIHASD